MALSLDDALQASRRERNAKMAQEMLGTNPQKLAQEMLGKNRRSNAPRAGPAPVTGTMAGRVGVVKRSTSIPRTNSAPLRNPRTPSHLSRPPINDNYRPAPTPPTYVISSDSASDAKSNGYAREEAVNGGAELNIRGAAVVGGPYIVKAQNFAPGTTAADIESVMASIGGDMNYCRLSASHPTVIAEMSFPLREGADKVIEMFNGKKADGRTLYVFMHSVDGGATVFTPRGKRQQPPPEEEEPLPAIVDTTGDVEMEVDEHANARALENRQREERRGRDMREPAYPAAERNDYPREPRRAEPEYQDGRYGFDGRDRRYNGRGGGGGGGGARYREDDRFYSNRMRRGGGGSGQSYRP